MLNEGPAPTIEPTEAEKQEQLAHVQEFYNQVHPYLEHPERLLPDQPAPKEFPGGYQLTILGKEFLEDYSIERTSRGTSWLGISKNQVNQDQRIQDKVHVRFGKTGQVEGVGCYRIDLRDGNDKSKNYFEFHPIVEREVPEYHILTPEDIATALKREDEFMNSRESLGRKDISTATFLLQGAKATLEYNSLYLTDDHAITYRIDLGDGDVIELQPDNNILKIGKIDLQTKPEAEESSQQETLSTEQQKQTPAPATSAEAAPVDFVEPSLAPENVDHDQPVEFVVHPETLTQERLSEEKLSQLKEALPLLLELGLRHGWDENYQKLAMDERLAKLLDAENPEAIRSDPATPFLTTEKAQVGSASWGYGAVWGKFGTVHFQLDRDGFRSADDPNKLRDTPREPLVGSPEDFDKIYEAIKQRVGDDWEEQVHTTQQRIEELKQKLGNPERTGGSSG